jgi:hypothetical protein
MSSVQMHEEWVTIPHDILQRALASESRLAVGTCDWAMALNEDG